MLVLPPTPCIRASKGPFLNDFSAVVGKSDEFIALL